MNEALLYAGGVVPGHDHIAWATIKGGAMAQLARYNETTAARGRTVFTPIVVIVRLQHNYNYSKGASLVPVIEINSELKFT